MCKFGNTLTLTLQTMHTVTSYETYNPHVQRTTLNIQINHLPFWWQFLQAWLANVVLKENTKGGHLGFFY